MSNSKKQNTAAPQLSEDNLELSKLITFETDLIWVEPVCNFFEISYRNATRSIQNDHFLASHCTKKSSDLLFSDKRSRFLLTKQGFIRWIQIVNPNTVRPDLREKFVKFQVLVFDYLYGAAEQQAEEAKLYAEIQEKTALRKALATDVRKAQQRLNRILCVKYGQLELPMGNN